MAASRIITPFVLLLGSGGDRDGQIALTHSGRLNSVWEKAQKNVSWLTFQLTETRAVTTATQRYAGRAGQADRAAELENPSTDTASSHSSFAPM